MNRRVLIGIVIAVVGIGLIGLGILAINNILKRSLAAPIQPTPVVESTTDIVVASHDLTVGAVINREDVQLATVPVSLVPRNAMLTIESVLGKIAMVHLIQGEMVLQHHLADPTNVSHDIGYIIEPDQVLMAFPSTDLMSGLGVLQRGDNVDIFATMTVEVTPTNTTTGVVTGSEAEKRIATMFTFDAFQRQEVNAIVVQVISEATETKPAQTRVAAYLLAMNAQEALVLKHMRDAGATFDIVLRSPTSNELFEVSPVTEDYLIQRFELQVPR